MLRRGTGLRQGRAVPSSPCVYLSSTGYPQQHGMHIHRGRQCAACVATRYVLKEKSPMVRTTAIRWLALLIPLLLVGAQAPADERPGKHKHDDKAPHGKTAGDHGQTTEGHTHQHPWWDTPPAEYANARGTRWGDAAAVARGQQLFETYCLMCHGPDGKGTGPLAKTLPHPPADLTHHFHRAPGDGDAYLFWRVSEIGRAHV